MNSNWCLYLLISCVVHCVIYFRTYQDVRPLNVSCGELDSVCVLEKNIPENWSKMKDNFSLRHEQQYIWRTKKTGNNRLPHCSNLITRNDYFIKVFSLKYVYGCFLCIYVCVPHGYAGLKETRRGHQIPPPWLALLTAMSNHEGAGNWTQILWKSCQSSQHLSC